ncbi:ribonuclease H-like domain-containing protein [Tanacetum coccineum]
MFSVWGGNRDHVPACLCYLLYYVVNSKKFNLAFYMAKRMEWVTKQKRLILPYGMLLTRLFKFVMNENPELMNAFYVLYDRVMNPLTAQHERMTRRDCSMRRGRHSTSSTSAFDQPSLSHLNDDDDDDGNSNTTTKLPILKLGEYEMWVIRIKQYFQVQDYALWDVIENGNSWVSVPQTTQENGASVTKMSVPATAEEMTNKKNDVKARSLLLMALPNEHQFTFSHYNDAKTMFAAIETRFGGNEATKKTHKAFLKQQYENFSASSIESLDSIFNRIQKIVSRLAILGVVITQEDLNSKILRSLPPEWNTHVVVWMNKADIETMSIDDLYNNFKIVKQDVKKFVGASTSAQNMAFMTVPSTSSTNDVNTYEVSTVSPNDLEQIHEDDLEAIDLKWHLSLLSTKAKRYFQRTGKKIFINANDTAGYDKSKVECFNCHKMGHFARECKVPRNKDGQFRYQDNTRKQGNNEDTSSKVTTTQVQTNMALMMFSDSELNQTEFIAATYKRGLATIEEQLVTYRKNEVLFSEEVADFFKRASHKRMTKDLLTVDAQGT